MAASRAGRVPHIRRTVVIGLGLVLSAAVVGGGWAVQQMQARRLAAAVATAASVEASAAIPQDAAAMEKRRREWLEWSRRTLEGAYDRVGKRDARWDEPARKALERAARRYSLEVDPEVTRGDILTPASAPSRPVATIRWYSISTASTRPGPTIPERPRRSAAPGTRPVSWRPAGIPPSAAPLPFRSGQQGRRRRQPGRSGPERGRARLRRRAGPRR